MELPGMEVMVLVAWGLSLFIGLYPIWVILKRIGISPWLSLLMFVPLVNLLTLYYIAFAKWRGEAP
jgi:hypothetical protein